MAGSVDTSDYVPRCPCVLPPLTADQSIPPLFEVAQCEVCGTTWTVRWRRDPGGETQPWWDATTAAPTDWTPPDPPEGTP